MNPSVEITAVTQTGAVLVALIGLAGILLSSGAWVSGRRSRRAADAARAAADGARAAAEAAVHELLPNSGTSSRDSLDRLEHAVGVLSRDVDRLAKDVGGLREENRDDRRAMETRLSGAELRMHELEHPTKENA